jgi:hypothetical protein
MLTAEDEIVSYLRKRLEYLHSYNADIESRLDLDTQEFINAHQDKRACNAYLWRIEAVLQSTFRYTILIAVCTFLEEAVKLLCGRSVVDYEKEIKACRHGTWLAKHRRLLADNPQVDLAAIKADLDTMEEFIKVRNCIVHEWGRVNKTVDRIIGIDEKRGANHRFFSKYKDGFLFLTDQAVPAAIFASENIVRRFLHDLLGPPAHCAHQPDLPAAR